jgi:DNA-directed RNA polymerase specialized sigma24 family protein
MSETGRINYADLSYDELMPLSVAKDPLALAELWSRLVPDLEPLARVSRTEPSLRGLYDTDAMLATTFRRFAAAFPRHQFATTDDALRFAVAILRNRRISLRQRRLTAEGQQREGPLSPEAAHQPAPDDAALTRRHDELLDFLRQHLPADVVALAEMRADLLNWREIGELLNRHPDTLRSYYERALESFRARFPAHDFFPGSASPK